MEYMFETYEEKVITPVGKKLMLATKQYLAQRPYLFPEDDKNRLLEPPME
jgi:hypothetical protein